MLRVSVRWNKPGLYWDIEVGREPWGPAYEVKREAVRVAAEQSKSHAKSFGEPVSLRIYTRRGTVGAEFTYPRKSDPRRSRG